MKFANLILALAMLTFISCKEDEPEPEPTFLELITGSHPGNLEEFSCALPPASLGTVSMTADISEVSSTEVSVSLNNSAGEFLSFNGMINSDTTFAIVEFENDGKTYNGSGKLINKLEIFMGDGCTVFGTEAAVLKFVED